MSWADHNSGMCLARAPAGPLQGHAQGRLELSCVMVPNGPAGPIKLLKKYCFSVGKTVGQFIPWNEFIILKSSRGLMAPRWWAKIHNFDKILGGRRGVSLDLFKI